MSPLFCALLFSVIFHIINIDRKHFEHEYNVVNSDLVVTWSFENLLKKKIIKEGFMFVKCSQDNSAYKSC